MPKVLCTLPNASEEIGGIKFSKHEKGMLSEEITEDQAARLAGIAGDAIVGAKADTGEQEAKEKAEAEQAALAAKAKAESEAAADKLKADAEAAKLAEQQAKEEAAKAEQLAKSESENSASGEKVDDEKAALQAKADDLGVKHKANWGIDRLKAEVEAAEKAKSEAAQ